MKGKRPRQTKHADCFTSDTPLSSVSVPLVFPFDKTIVAINSVSLTIISTSSIIVDDCETSISIPSTIKSINDSIFSVTEMIIRATSPIIFVPQITNSSAAHDYCCNGGDHCRFTNNYFRGANNYFL